MSKELQNACNNFDLRYEMIGLENKFSIFLREVVLHRFYCIQLVFSWSGLCSKIGGKWDELSDFF